MAKEGERKLSLGCSDSNSGSGDVCVGRGRRAAMCPRCGKTSSFVYGEVIGTLSLPGEATQASHFLILSEWLRQLWHIMAAAASHPHGFLSLSLTWFPVSCAAPRLAHPPAPVARRCVCVSGGRGHQRGDGWSEQEDADRKDGRLPSPSAPPPHPLPLLFFTSAAQTDSEKRK